MHPSEMSWDLFASNADAISRRRRRYVKAQARRIVNRIDRRGARQWLRACARGMG